MKEIRWHGRGGQGAFTASKILGGAAVLSGKYALAFPSFGPERRGAPVRAYTKIGEDKITDRSALQKADYIIYLDETLFDKNVWRDLKENGKVFINTTSKEGENPDYAGAVLVDANTISEEILGRPVSNTVMLAALAAGTGVVSLDNLKDALGDYLSQKLISKNIQIIDEVGRILGKEA